MKLLQLCVCYDPYDNYTFDYVAFADMASAKSYKRHWTSPGNYGVQIIGIYANIPVGKIINREDKLNFLRCKLAEEATDTEAYRMITKSR